MKLKLLQKVHCQQVIEFKMLEQKCNKEMLQLQSFKFFEVFTKARSISVKKPTI